MAKKEKDEIEEWLYPKMGWLLGVVVLVTIGTILWVAFWINPK